jgi:hypothetical protein
MRCALRDRRYSAAFDDDIARLDDLPVADDDTGAADQQVPRFFGAGGERSTRQRQQSKHGGEFRTCWYLHVFFSGSAAADY